MAGEAPLSHLCDEIVDCPHSTPVWTDSGPIVLRNQNIRNGRLDLSDPSHTDEKHFSERTRRALPSPGDLVITREAPMGEVCMIPPDLRCCLGQRMVLLRPNRHRVDPRYLLYALQSDAVQHEIRVNEGTGSTVSNLRIPLLKALPIPVRFLAEQRAIAHILGTLDDKIELNRRMSETLEAMARELFESWFLNFDPTRSSGDAIDAFAVRDSRGQFPRRLIHSELGLIPEGWQVRPAGELFEIAIGRTPPRKEEQWFSTDPNDIPWMSIRDLGQASVFISDVSEYLTAAAVERFRIRRIPEGTVVLSFKLTVGRTAITAREMLSNEAIAHFLPRGEGLSAPFLYCYLRQFDYGALGSTSSIATAVNSESVRTIPILLPVPEVHDAFARRVAPLFNRLRRCQAESRTLAALRDTLLPKLISGDLRVKDAKHIVADVV